MAAYVFYLKDDLRRPVVLMVQESQLQIEASIKAKSNWREQKWKAGNA
jgi:hypothetical protein